jgi:DNA-binding MarR family transcriptional regulator
MPDKFYKLPQDLTARNDLRPSDKLVYAVLLDHLGDNDFCWPGIRRLALATGLTALTVIDCIKRLEAAKLLTVERRENGRSNYYRLPETGKETIPVKKSYRYRNHTSSGKGTISEAVKKLYPNQTDLLNETNICRKISRFTQPAAGEVSDFARSIGFQLDGQAFVDHYESTGWMIGKARMKDWRAAVRNWKRRDVKSPRTEGKLSRVRQEVVNDGNYVSVGPD